MCTLVFILVYLFTMASSLWWLILTLTWFLTTGRIVSYLPPIQYNLQPSFILYFQIHYVLSVMKQQIYFLCFPVLKWAEESLVAYAPWFHLVGWGLPTIKTGAILILSGVQGDSVAGICYTGTWNFDLIFQI